MFDRESKIAVIGAGAIGGVTAGFIARAGYNVEVVCNHQELAEKIKSGGLHIFGVKGNYKVAVPAVAKISELWGSKEIILLATKATDMLSAAGELLPFITDTSVVICMQNGICEDALAEVIGRQRTIGCIVGWGATVRGPGELQMTSRGNFVIGNIDNQPDPRLPAIKKILRTVNPVRISENIMGDLYSKLIINSCVTSLGAICGLYLGEMLSIKKLRNIAIEIIRECMAVAGAMDIEVEVFAGKLDYDKFLRDSGFFGNMRRHLFLRTMGYKYRRLRSSSLRSLEIGKPTEIDYLNGYISANGRKNNVPTPVNDRIVRIIKDIEAGRRPISPANFNAPFFERF